MAKVSEAEVDDFFEGGFVLPPEARKLVQQFKRRYFRVVSQDEAKISLEHETVRGSKIKVYQTEQGTVCELCQIPKPVKAGLDNLFSDDECMAGIFGHSVRPTVLYK